MKASAPLHRPHSPFLTRSSLWHGLCLMLCLWLSLPSAHARVWRWSNPKPHGNNVVDMIHTNGLYLQLAEKGQLYTSPDLLHWTPHSTEVTNFLRSVTYHNDRYVVTGEAGLVLLITPNFEFTRISLNTSDWLESVAAAPNQVVAVGDNGSIFSSPDALQWTRRSAPSPEWLRSVTHGTAYGKSFFLAAGENGAVTTSQDGVQWQPVAPFTSDDINHVAHSQDRFLALTDAGQVWTTTNGTAWDQLPLANTNSLFAHTFSPAASLLAGDTAVWLAPGIRPFADQTDPSLAFPAPPAPYYTALWDGGAFVLAGQSGELVEGFLQSGQSSYTWLSVFDSLRSWLWDITGIHSVALAVGNQATILSSTDGIDWHFEVPPVSVDTVLLGVGGRTNLAVAVGGGGTILLSPDEQQPVTSTNQDGTITTNFTSTLGIQWEQVSSPVQVDLQGIAATPDVLVLSGANGTILTSGTGQSWSVQSTPTANFLSSVTAFPGGFIACGDGGTILHSTNGADWSARPTGLTTWIYRAEYLNGQLIAVGENGTILTSPDGLSWTLRPAPTSTWLNDVTWIDGSYFATGLRGTLLSSPNATDWILEPLITRKSIYAATEFDGQLLAAGIEGTILRSRIVPDTDPIFTQFTHLPGPDSVTNRFIFSGNPDQRFTLDRSQDLDLWQNSSTFEFLDNSRFLIFEEVAPNPPPYQFFRTTPQP